MTSRIFEAIESITPCSRTKSLGCQCDKLNQLSENKQIIQAVSILEHTVGKVEGAIRFQQEPGKPTVIKGIIKGLTPGKHGFHIHEFGDLSDGCASAGAHYNPTGVKHGSIDQGHIGDLGNITADDSGTARFQIMAERVELADIVGRAIVIHANEDDLGLGNNSESLTTGNAGDRVGCGVIRLRGNVEESIRPIKNKHYRRNQLPQIKLDDITNKNIAFKEGKISFNKIKPVQSERVPGLALKAENLILNLEQKPIVIDKNGYIVNGHHRYDVYKTHGANKVHAIMVGETLENLAIMFKDKISTKSVIDEGKYASIHNAKDYEPENLEVLIHGVGVYTLDQLKNRLKTRLQHFIDNMDYNSEGVEKIIKGESYDAFVDMLSGYNEIKAELETPQMKRKRTLAKRATKTTENFADGKVKGKSRPGRVKKAGASCKGSVTDLRAKAKKYSGEKGKMYQWCLNMKAGKK